MVKQTTRDRMIEKASQLIREYGYQNIPLRKLASWLIWIGCLLRVRKRKRFSCSSWTPSSQAMGILLPKAWSLLMRKSIAQCSMIY